MGALDGALAVEAEEVGRYREKLWALEVSDVYDILGGWTLLFVVQQHPVQNFERRFLFLQLAQSYSLLS